VRPQLPHSLAFWLEIRLQHWSIVGARRNGLRPVVLTIAGSDSSAGAGVQADLKSIEASGGWAATVITAVTAQGPSAVRHVHPLPARSVAAQLAAVFDELPVAAVKTGMMVGSRTVGLVARTLRERRSPIVVCDPVVTATSGTVLLDAGGIRALIRQLLPLATVVTPNALEAELLSGIEVRDLEAAERAGRAILALGPQAVLVKGGHLPRPERATDLLVDRAGAIALRAEALEGGEVHGTGCVLAAAIATHLARGRELREAVRLAKDFVTRSIRAAAALGAGSIVDPLYALHDRGAPRPLS
jgi:hydroxymethylpyrimidine/phosphomethylpyrimidine kinase